MTIVFNVVLILTAIGATILPPYYHLTADWWSTSMGRHVMGYSCAAALLADSGVVRVFLPDLPSQEWIRLVAISFACVFVWQRLYIFIKTQRADDEAERT